MTGLLAELNDEQREAVTTTEGFVRVIAGAGSGKTRALAHRFAYLVNEVGILPGSILCVTFTNKSAAEMRQRIHQLTGDNDAGYICTFHSFCVSILQEDSHAVQYPKRFLVLDNADIDVMLQTIYEERGLTLRHMTFSKARDMIEIRKIFKEPDYYRDMLAMPLEILHEKYLQAVDAEDIIFYGYLYQEKKCFGLDYNDLIKFTLYIFEQNEDIRLKWQQRLEYIMIDEFQDIDELQYKLMEVLCGYHKNLFIVGDPDQTIYTWRGANVKYLLDFDKAFPGCRTIMMMRNYRSTPQVLHAVNSLIDKNVHRIKKDLIPTLPEGQPVLYHHAVSAEQEAVWIADRIRELAGQGVPLRDVAVLYRAHYVTRTLEEVFRKRELPYTIYSGAQFFDRKEIKDALSYLRMIAYRDDLSFQRIANVPRRNLGEKRMRFIKEYAEQNGCSLYESLQRNLEHELFNTAKVRQFIHLIEDFAADYPGKAVSEVLAALLNRSGYEEMLRTEGSQERLDNLAELKQSVYEYENACGEECTLEDYLSHVALFSNSDAAVRREAVKLMTVHTAKGLEFPYVFLCSLCEGVFPSTKTKTMPAMEEERRLAFVGMTRAQRGLFLSDNEGRNADGSSRVPSRFIFDIDRPLLEYTAELPGSLVREAKDHIRFTEKQLQALAAGPAFAAGERVTHAVFGDGTILGIDIDHATYQIRFDDIHTPRNISFKILLRRTK